MKMTLHNLAINKQPHLMLAEVIHVWGYTGKTEVPIH